MSTDPSSKQVRRSYLAWAIALLIGLSPLPLSFLYATSSYGSPDVYARVAWIPGYLSLGCLSFVIWLPILFLAIFFKPLERAALIACPVILIFIASTITSMFLTTSLAMKSRDACRKTIIMNSRPIIQAIEKFQADHNGDPPTQLMDLVPNYLPSIPDTGIGCYPRYIYFLPGEIPYYYPKSDWILHVSMHIFMDGDSLYFLPAQNYDETPMREAVTLIPMGDGRNWGYFNE